MPPPCGVTSSHPSFSARDYSGKSHETTSPGFARGSSAPVWSYGDVLALAGSHPCMVTQAPLRS
jgi:hypothetical protein